MFLPLENPCTFFLTKEKTGKRIFNTNTELSQNRTEKQIMPSKTIPNWLFNDVWCYLFIACYDWKIGVFQQTVVRVYYILKFISKIFCILFSEVFIVWMYFEERKYFHFSVFTSLTVFLCILIAGNAVDVCVVDTLKPLFSLLQSLQCTLRYM